MATLAHCIFCFDVLDAHLTGREAPSLADVEASFAKFTNTSAPSAAPGDSPLFVTWNTDDSPYASPGEYVLRGCIGTFETQPLAAGLAAYALTAALEDSRFKPITARELPHLQVGVTLLTDFEPARDALDWTLGTHGLRIAFADPRDPRRRYGGTYLPDVPPEQGWTKEETVASLMHKAGWRKNTANKRPWETVASFDTVRYQGSKKSLTYAEYKAWKDWAAKQ